MRRKKRNPDTDSDHDVNDKNDNNVNNLMALPTSNNSFILPWSVFSYSGVLERLVFIKSS